jgi:hypothetical protein
MAKKAVRIDVFLNAISAGGCIPHLDVLSADEFAAAGVSPEGPLLPGGARWDKLTDVVSAALRAGCAE